MGAAAKTRSAERTSGNREHRLLRCHTVRASAELRTLPGHRTAAQEEKPVAAEGVVMPRAPRGSNCPRFVRQRLAARLPDLCEALLERAVAGDLNAAKLLWQMAELDKRPAAAKSKPRSDVGLARKALAEFRAR